MVPTADCTSVYRHWPDIQVESGGTTVALNYRYKMDSPCSMSLSEPCPVPILKIKLKSYDCCKTPLEVLSSLPPSMGKTIFISFLKKQGMLNDIEFSHVCIMISNIIFKLFISNFKLLFERQLHL